jgi:hypothetical protein
MDTHIKHPQQLLKYILKDFEDGPIATIGRVIRLKITKYIAE